MLSLIGIGTLFYVTYRWDNKYAFRPDSSVTVLADEWEFYPDCTSLTEIGQPYLITIGQFGSFSSYNKSGSPFGAAVYRKHLYLEPASGGWLLELPEIFSACKVYVNGELVRSYGSLSQDNYHISIKNTLLPLPDGDVEIVIQASNYSHYYSGLIYPPIVGESGAVTQLVACRLIFYALLCFFTLGCAAVSFTVWFHRRADALYVAFGCLCIAFAVHISYPLVHWIGINAGVLPYVVEDTAYFVMLICMAVLTYRLSGPIWHNAVHIGCYVFSIAMGLFPLLAFYILFPAFPLLVSIYSSIMALAKIIMSGYLIVTAFLGAFRNSRYLWLLSGNAVFGFGIFFDYASSGRFEPVRFGWQTEYCGFVMVLLFMTLILKHNKRALAERQYLIDHLQDEVARKTAYLSSMLEERRQFLSAVSHDLKAPMAAVNTYINYIRDSSIEVDAELLHYLDIIDHKSAQMQSQVKNLQLFHEDSSSGEQPSAFDCNDFLRYIYEETLPYADANGIYYDLELPEETGRIYGKKENLFRAFENLVINATEHTPLEGTILLSARYYDNFVRITLTDDGQGIPADVLAHIFQYGYSTKEPNGIRGLGLYFTKMSIEEYGGSIDVKSCPEEYTSFHIVFPLQPEISEGRS